MRGFCLLAALSWLDERDAQHVWDGGESGVGSVAVVDLVNLDPETPGASVLKLMRRGRSDEEVAAHAAALHDDHALSDETRRRVIASVENGRIPMERRESEHVVDYWRRIDQARGVRRSLFRVLAARGFDSDLAAQTRIEACEDADVLLDWLQRAVTAERFEDIFDDG